jgi:hypothetical protein
MLLIVKGIAAKAAPTGNQGDTTNAAQLTSAL